MSTPIDSIASNTAISDSQFIAVTGGDWYPLGLRKDGAVAAVAGLLTGNFTAAGAGILSASHSSMTAEFRKVSAVKALPLQHTTKLRSGLMHNQG